MSVVKEWVYTCWRCRQVFVRSDKSLVCPACRAADAQATTRLCAKCKRFLPITAYRLTPHGLRGLACRSCTGHAQDNPTYGPYIPSEGPLRPKQRQKLNQWRETLGLRPVDNDGKPEPWPVYEPPRTMAEAEARR